MAENYFLRRAHELSYVFSKHPVTPTPREGILAHTGPPELFLPGQWLACCGQWWPVQDVPFVCPQCGQRYLVRQEGEKAP